jgi:hypothetical protein
MLHPIKSLIAQRIYGLIMGYEDLNDHEELRDNPMFALALEKRIGLENESAKLAGKSTLNRLEHCPEDVEQGADSPPQYIRGGLGWDNSSAGSDSITCVYTLALLAGRGSCTSLKQEPL